MEDLLIFNRNKIFQGEHFRLLEFPQLRHSLMHIFLEIPNYLLQLASVNPLEQFLYNRLDISGINLTLF